MYIQETVLGILNFDLSPGWRYVAQYSPVELSSGSKMILPNYSVLSTFKAGKAKLLCSLG